MSAPAGAGVPEPRRLIVEADGGSRGNPGPAAYGAIVRDARTGEALARVAETIGVATNNVAEYRGLIAGLEAAHAIAPDGVVEARLDSKLVVEQMSGRWKIKNPDLRPLALHARRVFPPDRVTYVWVPRARNADADRLVNQALDGTPEPPADPAPDSPGNRLAAWTPELGIPTRILAVRHGRTAFTSTRRFNGSGGEDPSLDDDGRHQAEQLGQLLAASGAVSVIASPALRARQTADAIAGVLDVAVQIDDRWRECDFGLWDGLTLEQITERFPAELARWLGSTSSAPPDGESLDEVAARVAAAREEALGRHPGQTLVVVTHSMPVRALVRSALDAPPQALYRLQPASASLTELAYYADGTTAVNAFGQRSVGLTDL